MITDSETLKEMDWLEAVQEFYDAEKAWLKNMTYKNGQRSRAAEEKVIEMFCEGWADLEMARKAWEQYRRRLLHRHRAQA